VGGRAGGRVGALAKAGLGSDAGTGMGLGAGAGARGHGSGRGCGRGPGRGRRRGRGRGRRSGRGRGRRCGNHVWKFKGAPQRGTEARGEPPGWDYGGSAQVPASCPNSPLAPDGAGTSRGCAGWRRNSPVLRRMAPELPLPRRNRFSDSYALSACRAGTRRNVRRMAPELPHPAPDAAGTRPAAPELAALRMARRNFPVPLGTPGRLIPKRLPFPR
jgi:hypothetical protein